MFKDLGMSGRDVFTLYPYRRDGATGAQISAPWHAALEQACADYDRGERLR